MLPSNCLIWAWWQWRTQGGWVHIRWTTMNRWRWLRWPHAYWEDIEGVWWEYTLPEKRVRCCPPPLFFGIVKRR
jgi:hypothetical protein